MITIKDIAKRAGVAQGTVSNVLNDKGNVSSEKIKQVMDAALALGYIPNERAKFLRKGQTNVLAVILPNIRSKQYVDFYLSFKHYAELHNFSVLVQLTNDNNNETEIAAVQQLRSYMVNGIAVISSFQNHSKNNPYTNEDGSLTESEQLLFVDRRVSFSNHYIGFNYELAGQALAQKALKEKYTNITVLTGSLQLPNEAAFYQGFSKTIAHHNCNVQYVETDGYRKLPNIMHIFEGTAPQAVFVSNYGFTENVKDIYNSFFFQKELPIYTVSPLYTMPENDYIKYELNYRKLGATAAKQLIDVIQNGKTLDETILEPSGFRNWHAHIITAPSKEPLNVLTLDSPSAYNMRQVSQLYTQKTGTPVHITIYSYDEMYEAFSTMNQSSVFDVLRLDVTWLSWFAERILQPLEYIDPSVEKDLDSFIPGIAQHYSWVNNHIYALPATPSLQMLFYRKDLLESPICKRMYWEEYKQELQVPTTFDEFNQIASFFTHSLHPASPVKYGTTMTLGSTGVASSEYLARLFSHQDHLYGTDGKVNLQSDISIKSLEELIAVKNFSNPQYSSWWTNTASSFAKGEAAMAILYSNYASDILNSKSKVIGNIGYAVIPGNNPQIGGGSLGVSKYTKRPEEALSFIRWMCSEPISSARTVLGSVSPCKLSYDNFDIITTYPWLSCAEESFISARGRRVPELVNNPFDERKFLSILGMAVKNTYSGVQSAADALKNAQKLYEESFHSN